MFSHCVLQEWFGGNICSLCTELLTGAGSTDSLATAVQTLQSLAQDFTELAHTCLLVLHLEVHTC